MTRKKQKSKPIAVLISDVHYNLQTLEVADKAMNLAIDRANELDLPLIVCGDLHDTKANMRAECVNAMINTFDRLRMKATIIVGNHCKVSEKSKEHSLNFLREHVNFIVNEPRKFSVELDSGEYDLGYHIPYYHDANELRAYLKTLPKGSQLIMHQGLTSSNSGDYIQDKSAINPQDVAGFRVISGHYHTRQAIQLPDGGVWDYVGNPYTLTYGEANDPPKGFQVLYSDGSLEFVPTNLRKHAIIEHDILRPDTATIPINVSPGDLIWVKLSGPSDLLSAYEKHDVSDIFGLEGLPFKLDLIPYDTRSTSESTGSDLSQAVVLDLTIDELANTSDERKERLKQMWKNL